MFNDLLETVNLCLNERVSSLLNGKFSNSIDVILRNTFHNGQEFEEKYSQRYLFLSPESFTKDT